jgi:hypothetical protein
MQCPECNSPLMASNSKYKSDEGSTDVYVELTLCCVNPKCGTYAGTNLNEPLKIAATVRNKVS